MIDLLLDELRNDDALTRHLGPRRQPRLHAVLIPSPWVGRSVWAVFGRRRAAPTVIVKMDADPRSHPRLRREHQTLTALHRRSSLRGLVPAPVLLGTVHSRLVLVQSGLQGTPLTVRARNRLTPSRPHNAAEHRAVLRWLQALQAVPAPSSMRLDVEDVLGRCVGVGGHTAGMQSLATRLRRTMCEWDDPRVPVVPLHGDLTAGNILLHRRDARVFDWEAGLATGTALADLVVFLKSYARAQPSVHGWGLSQEAGFRRAFCGGGWLARLSTGTFCRHLDHLRLPRAAAEALLVTTLVELAEGSSGAAHVAASRREWAGHLKAYTEAPSPWLRRGTSG